MSGWTKQEVETELKRRQQASADEEKARREAEAKRRLSVPLEDRCIHCHIGTARRSGLCDGCLHAD